MEEMMSDPDLGQAIDSAYERRANAERDAEDLSLDGAPLDDLAVAADRLRQSQVHLLIAVMNDMETMGMGFQDEPWWPEFCALKKKLP
jgi:hypothetical protein